MPKTDPLLDGLTERQKEAVTAVDGPLLTLAGPGSGKTRTITHRIARIVAEAAPARSVLAITFTNKASREMADRVQALIGPEPVFVSTFHKFCARLLRSHAGYVGLASNYSILDVPDQRRLVKDVLSQLDIDSTHYQPDRVLSMVSNLKNDLITPEQFARRIDESVADHFQSVVAKVYPHYQRALLSSNAVDFDDLLMHVAIMLSENDGLREHLSNRFRYILVDEYQDTNTAQYRVIAALASTHRNLCVTGDPDQSIYGWRGARISNILSFERDFPEAKVVRLEDNFRSTHAILRVADAVIDHNRQRKRKQLVGRSDEGTPVRVVKYDDGTAEADAIAEEISRLITDEGRSPSDFAIFYRVNSLSREVERALSRARVPYQIAQGTAFYDRAEVKDVLAYLRLIANPADRTAFQRIVNRPARRLGETSQKKVARWAEDQGLNLLEAAAKALSCEPLSRPARGGFRAFAELIESIAKSDEGSVAKLVRTVVDRTGYLTACERSPDDKAEDMIANVEEIISAAAQYDRRAGDDATLEGFLDESALVSDTDSLDAETAGGSVTLMTLHAAKGLEFPSVYIIGLEQGLLPHERSLRENTGDEVEEERRLLFVGITRAEKELTITHTAARALRGRVQITIQSQFLPELEIETEDRTNGFPGYVSRGGGRDSKYSSADEWEEPSVDVNADRDERGNDGDDASLFSDEADSPADERDRKSGKQASERRGKGSFADSLKGLQLTTAADLLNGSVRKVDLNASFHVGQKVRHPHYGLGVVKAIGEVNRRKKVTVDFGSSEETMIVGIAPLEPA